jgi:multiple antibiotic resistance protein
MDWALFTTVFAGFFAIMNPIANTPIFLGLTDGMNSRGRRNVAFTATLVAFIVVATFCALGQVIFSVFGITIAAFRLAGGAIVFLIGYRMLQGQNSALHQTEQAQQAGASVIDDAAPTTESDQASQVGISPLGVPLLAGPGTIATAIGFSAGQWEKALLTGIAFLLLCVLTYLSFVMGERLMRVMGRQTILVVTRLMGLILAVIGTQMFLHGLKDAGLYT